MDCMISLVFALMLLLMCDGGSTSSLENSYSLIEPWDLCTSMDFCYRKAKTALKDNTTASRCQPCSCTEDCFVFGNCCPDVTLNAIKEFPTVPCMSSAQFMNPRMSEAPQDDDFFRVIKTCPDSANVSDNTRAGCMENSSIELCIPVSSSDGFRMYRNVHCAICHGERDTISWKLFALCNVDPSAFLNEYQMDEVNRNCRLDTVAPALDFKRKVMCLPDTDIVSKTCNITGLWDVYDYRLEEKCMFGNETSLYNTLIYSDIHKKTPFHNHYCYLCNMPFNHTTDDSFPDKTDKPWTNKMIYQNLMFLLEHGVHSNPGVASVSNKQNEDGVRASSFYDPVAKVRRIVTCRHGFVFHGDSCTPFANILKVKVAVVFRLINMSLVAIPKETTYILQAIGQDFEINLHSLGCGVNFKHQFMASDIHGNIYFVIGVSTIYTCPLNRFLDTVKPLAGQMFKFEVNVNFKQHYFVFKLETDINNTFINLKSMRGLLLNAELLKLCPRFNISVNEIYQTFDSYVAHKIMSNRIPGTLNGDFFLMCTADYFSVTTTNRSNGLFSSQINSFTFITMIGWFLSFI